MTSKKRQKARKSETQEIHVMEVGGSLDRAAEENDQTQLIGFKNREKLADTSSARSVVLAEPSQTNKNFKCLHNDLVTLLREVSIGL